MSKNHMEQCFLSEYICGGRLEGAERVGNFSGLGCIMAFNVVTKYFNFLCVLMLIPDARNFLRTVHFQKISWGKDPQTRPLEKIPVLASAILTST